MTDKNNTIDRIETTGRNAYLQAPPRGETAPPRNTSNRMIESGSCRLYCRQSPPMLG